MKIKVVLCNCNGLDVEPESLDMNSLPHEIEEDIDVQYAVMHPQLCGRGGVNLLRDLLRSSDQETYFLVAGCGPELQPQFMSHVLTGTGFPPDHFIPVDIHGTDNEGARTAVLEAVGRLLARKVEGSMAVDGFGG